MASSELTTWLLGIGGYTGVFTALAFLYANKTFPTHLRPYLVLAPLAAALVFYGFVQTLYLILKFAVTVFQAMLNEHVTITLIATTVLGGQIALLSVVIYRQYKNPVPPAAEELTADEYEHAVEEEEEEQEEEEEEEDMIDADAQHASEDADDEKEGCKGCDCTKPTDCANCETDCTKCMPGLVEIGLSGELACTKCTNATLPAAPTVPTTADVGLLTTTNSTVEVAVEKPTI